MQGVAKHDIVSKFCFKTFDYFSNSFLKCFKLDIFEENLIKVPSFRHDVRTHNDLAEEVARVIGYNNIEKLEINIPKSSVIEKKNIENKLRLFLIDHGFYEVINSPFVKKDSEESITLDYNSNC